MFLCIMHHYTDKYYFYSAPIYKSSYVLQSWHRYSSVSIDPAIAYFYQYLVQTLLTRSLLNHHNNFLLREPFKVEKKCLYKDNVGFDLSPPGLSFFITYLLKLLTSF